MTDTTTPAIDLDVAVSRARADGVACAEDVILRDGWRKAPGQSLVVAELIRAQPTKTSIKIMEAWNDAYHQRCIALTDA